MKQIRLQQGDSFTMTFVLKENGEPHNIQAGEDIAIGFYDGYCEKYVAMLSKGDIRYGKSTGLYIAQIPSSITKNFIGNVDVEIVIFDKNKQDMSHADKKLKMFFEERRINEDI